MNYEDTDRKMDARDQNLIRKCKLIGYLTNFTILIRSREGKNNRHIVIMLVICKLL